MTQEDRLEQSWLRLSRHCLPPDVSEREFAQRRQMFFCGAWALLGEIGESVIKGSAEEAIQAVDDLNRELDRFIEQIKRKAEEPTGR